LECKYGYLKMIAAFEFIMEMRIQILLITAFVFTFFPMYKQQNKILSSKGLFRFAISKSTILKYAI